MLRVTLAPFIHHSVSRPHSLFDALWNLKIRDTITAHRTSDVCLVNFDEGLTLNFTGLVYRKRYWYPGLSGKLKGFFRNTFFGASRASREFKNLSQLNALGLSLVRPLAVGEHRTCRFLNRAFIFTECLPDTKSLSEFLISERFRGYALEERRLFFCALGRWIFGLHHRGFYDGNLFARNILVHQRSRGLRFSKIDSPKGKGGQRPPGRGSPYLKDIKDLDQDLYGLSSRQDRLRAMLSYMGAEGVDKESRGLITRILLR
jgi:hypothetical protein